MRSSWHNPEYRELRGDMLELGKRCIFVNGQMGSRARRPFQVGLQDGGSLIHRNLFKAHLLAAAVTQNDAAICRLYISYPFHVRSEHGHKVTLTFNDNHNER